MAYSINFYPFLTDDDLIIGCFDHRKFVLCKNKGLFWSKQILVIKIFAIEMMACQKWIEIDARRDGNIKWYWNSSRNFYCLWITPVQCSRWNPIFFLLYRSESSAVVVVMSAMTTSLPRVSYNMHVTGESVEKPKEVKIR